MTELVKWRWLSLGVTLLGIIIIALPWIPGHYKIALGVPVYAAIVFVNYKYICLKKGPRQDGSPAGGVTGQKPSIKNSPGGQGGQPGKAPRKKSR
jgi:hypothetical protein